MFKIMLLFTIRLYQKAISPYLPPSCRYKPTCSAYTYTAIHRFGAIRGSMLGFIRIMSCNPFFYGGSDDVPEQWPGLWSLCHERKKRLKYKRALPPDREDEDIGTNNECN